MEKQNRLVIATHLVFSIFFLLFTGYFLNGWEAMVFYWVCGIHFGLVITRLLLELQYEHLEMEVRNGNNI